jgi:hypothetical protein
LAKAFVILVGVAGGFGLTWTVYWCKYGNGHEKYLTFVSKLCQRRSETVDTEDMTAKSNDAHFAEESSRKLAKGNSEDRAARQSRTTLASSSRDFSPYDSCAVFNSSSFSEVEA